MKTRSGHPIQESEQGGFFQEIQLEFLVHELKDPVAVIETALRAVLERRDKYGPLSPLQEKALNRALRNVKKTRDMVYNLLEIGRSESGCFQCSRFRPAVATRQVLTEVLEMMAASVHESLSQCRSPQQVMECLQNNGILLDIPADMETLEMEQDEIKYRQILGNLLKNAIHHRRKQIGVRLCRRDENLVVDVTDDGPGVDSAHCEMIFRRYTQFIPKDMDGMTRRGHGLGLAGARILARSMGGDVTVGGETGSGATFQMILPICLAVK